METDINNATSVVLGKYLSDRLYVSYGISLAEAINTFKMRWTIGKGWTIKTEAGKRAQRRHRVYTLQEGQEEGRTKKKRGASCTRQRALLRILKCPIVLVH